MSNESKAKESGRTLLRLILWMTVVAIGGAADRGLAGPFDRLRKATENTVLEEVDRAEDTAKDKAQDVGVDLEDDDQDDQKNDGKGESDEAGSSPDDRASAAAADQDSTELADAPGTLASFGAIKLPSVDGRVLLGTLITRQEMSDSYARDLDVRRAAQRAINRRNDVLEQRVPALNQLLHLARQRDIFDKLAGAYEEHGLTLPQKLRAYERDIIKLANSVLAPATLERYMQSKSSQPIGKAGDLSLKWRGENEFEQARAARQFMREQGPRLLNAIPDLPLKVRETTFITINDFNRQRGHFTFRHSDGTHPLTDELVSSFAPPTRLPATPQEAEQLLGKLGGNGPLTRMAYLVIDSTVHPPADHPASLGLPIKRVDSVVLAEDVLGRNVLHRFEVDQQPLPITEGGERVVKPRDPLLLSEEMLLMLLLLRDKPELAEHVDWKGLLRRNAMGRKTSATYPPFAPQPSGDEVATWWRASGADQRQADAYRQWTLDRAAVLDPLPLTLRLPRDYSLTVSEQQRRLGQQNMRKFRPFTGRSATDNQQLGGFKRSLQNQHGLTLADDATVNRSPYATKLLDGLKITYVMRGKPDTFDHAWPDDTPAKVKEVLQGRDPNERVAMKQWMDARLESITLLGDPAAKGEMILAFSPIAAAWEIDGQTILARDYTDQQLDTALVPYEAPEPEKTTAQLQKERREQAEQQAEAAVAPQAIPDGPYGPALMDVQMGMSIKQADQKVRENFEVAHVYEATAHRDNAEPYRKIRMYADAARRDFVKIYYGAPTAPDRVLAISRKIVRDHHALPFEPVLNTLKKKYGEPEEVKRDTAIWGMDFTHGMGSDDESEYAWTLENGEPFDHHDRDVATLKPLQPGLGFLPQSIERTYSRLGPAVVVTVDEVLKPRTNGRERLDTASIQVIDLAAASAYWNAWQQQQQDQPAQTLDLGL